MAVLGQKREHAPGRYQLPGQRLRVQQLPIRPRNPLHHSIITRHTGRSRQTRPALDELFSAVLGGGLFRHDIHRIAEQLDLAQQIDEIDPPSD